MNNEIKNLIISNNLDGYVLPKNDNYFTEYSKINNLKSITNFSGSAGFAVFLKKSHCEPRTKNDMLPIKLLFCITYF